MSAARCLKAWSVIDLEQLAEGIVLPVKARAGASRNEITGVHNGMLKVSVTQAPEKGKANQAILKLLATSLKLQKSQIEIVSGQTSPQNEVPDHWHESR